MNQYLSQFQIYLVEVRKLSTNSISAYLRDIPGFEQYLDNKNIKDINSATKADIAAYLLQLKQNGMSTSTVNRKLASLKAFYNCMVENNCIEKNPAVGIKSPKITRKDIEYLTIAEVDKILSATDNTDIGCRDLAVLELLYATGMRVTELMYADVDDINLRMGFISCDGSHGKARIIPVGKPARVALEKYIYDIRPHFRRGKAKTKDNEKALFLNYYGERITRQALWKILKSYSEKAGINKKITPQILRNSFAVHMIQNGADLKSLQELMGHEDPIATQAYLAVSKNRIKDVYDSAHPRA